MSNPTHRALDARLAAYRRDIRAIRRRAELEIAAVQQRAARREAALRRRLIRSPDVLDRTIAAATFGEE